MASSYLPRVIDGVLDRLTHQFPAVMVVGPRATGKTTTAIRHAVTAVRLDRPAEAAAFHADPDSALRGLPEPVLLDEWQVVPEVMGAVKRAVDERPDPARYILTGSVRADLEGETWPGTGRVIREPMYGLTIGERLGRPNASALLDRLAGGEEIAVPRDTPDLRGYIELALRSGFPQASLAPTDATANRWLESYVDQVVMRDAGSLEPGRDPEKLRRYLKAYALGSAGTVDESTLLEAAGINRKTAIAYERLLTNLLIVDAVPAWTSNRLKRLVLRPKRYLIDPGLFAGILNLDVASVMSDGDVLGRVLDTLVLSHLRSELPLSSTKPNLFHLRTESGRHEVDILAELAGGGIVGIEVKANAAPGRGASKHLEWLRDEIPDRFVAGVVLHTGPRTFRLDEKILAAPISSFWP